MKQTCYHCLHADFKAEANGTMRGFARCTKSKMAEDKSSYYFGGYQCDKGEFNPATADTTLKAENQRLKAEVELLKRNKFKRGRK